MRETQLNLRIFFNYFMKYLKAFFYYKENNLVETDRNSKQFIKAIQSQNALVIIFLKDFNRSIFFF
jgi:hypothetical protein